jgi:hypothetical protein
MRFEASTLFTSLRTLAALWIFVAVGLLAFVGARRTLRGPYGQRVSATLVGALLTLICVVSWLGVLAWLVNRHT